MFRSPLFWLAASLITAAAGAYSYTHFTTAFPVLNQTVKMDRRAAISAAQKLAAANQWRPGASPNAAAVVSLNNDLINFIELEAGGKENLGRLIRSREIEPTRWYVRLFREKNAAETLVEFSGDGRFLGFNEKLPDAETGRELGADDARHLAETSAAAMGLTLDGFKLVESTSHRTSSGRLDHTFTYERPSAGLGAGRQQRVLTVRGDRFSGFESLVKIPDDFFRRFSMMRASNKNLTVVSAISVVVILVLGAGVGGFVYLLRKSKLDWRGPVALAATVSVLTGALVLSEMPMSWFRYNTAISTSIFRTQLLIGVVVQMILMMFAALLYMTGEGLGRVAFPSQPRLWAVFSPRAAGTRPVFGAVAGAYLLCVLMFAYEVLIQTIGARHLGWWLPSQTLFDPNLLGASVPCLSPFIRALVAGTTEECLFRALPLAGAVLLGRRFGGVRWWVIGTLLLQALIFGSAHSTYPTMPGWARMAELFIPAVVFGALFLRFGLLPGILMHFLYDCGMMGLPLYASHVSNAGWNSAVLLAVTFAPLAWVSICRIRAGGWRELPEDLHNGAVTRQPGPTVPLPPDLPAAKTLSTSTLRRIAGAGALAAVLWVVLSHLQPPVPGLSIRKADAVAVARQFLEREGVHLGPGWQPLPLVQSGADNQRTFVWQTAGRTEFDRLLGKYLSVPAWKIRFVRQDGPLAERAEEYHVYVAGNREILAYEHVEPEARPLPTLAKPDALRAAEKELRRIYQLEPAAVELVAAIESKQPKRSDWRFVWKDPQAGLTQGEARIGINLAGDTLSGFGRFVFVPEAWTRADTEEKTPRNVTTGVLSFLLTLGIVFALVDRVRRWNLRPFRIRPALTFGGFMATVLLTEVFVKLPETMAQMSTTESFAIQIIRTVAIAVLGVAVVPAVAGFLVGIGSNRTEAAEPSRTWAEFLAGAGGGLIVLLAERLVTKLPPHLHPWHGGIDGANAAIPYLWGMWQVMPLAFNSLLLLSVQQSLAASIRSRASRVALLAAAGCAFGAGVNNGTWGTMVLDSLLYGAAFVAMDWLVRRTHPSVIVALVTGRMIGKAFEVVLIPAHPDAIGEGLVATALIALTGWFLYRLMRPARELMPPAPGVSDTVAMDAPSRSG